MAEDPSSKFKFDADDQEPEAFYRDEIKDLRVEKLSQRVTLISILLPCLIAVAIYFGYRDITGRVTRTHDTGSLEVQKLSKEIEVLSKQFNEKLITFSTTLSAQDKEFDTSLTGKLTSINKDIDKLGTIIKSLNEDLKQTLGTIKKLDASKADKKSHEAAIANINATLEPLKKELAALKGIRQDFKSVSSEIKNLESSLTAELAQVAASSAQSKKDYDQLQASIAKITSQSSEKVDKATLDLEVFKLKKNFQSLISRTITDLNERLDAIQKKIDDLRKISKSSKQSVKPAAKKIPPTSSTAQKAATNSETALSEPETIDEQDLTE